MSRNRVNCAVEAFELTKNNLHTSPRLRAPIARTTAFAIALLIVFAQLLAFGLVQLITNTPGDTYSNNQPITDKEFSYETAYAHLQKITLHPHHFNMRANDDVHNYILDYANHLRTAINPAVEVVDDDNQVIFTNKDTPSGLFGNSSFTGYMESGNVLVRIRGTANRGNALLISAHFDSAQLSYGANDNGIGVAAAMEMMRLAAVTPPNHDLIFNFNNFEEAGVLGSVAFMAHEWANTVRAFMNLEGAGAGGRVLLFQCSNPRLAKLASAIPRPTTSVLGNDLFQMRVINSITDYAVYTQRIPGVDFAIYRNRAKYHTTLDNIHHAYQSTLESMGQSLWPLAKAIDNSDFLETNPTIQSPGIFYSLLSLSTFQYSFATDHTLGVMVILLLLLTISIYSGCPSLQRGFYIENWRVALWPPFLALLMIDVGLFLFGIISFAVNSLIVTINPLATHRYWILVYLFNMLQAALCLTIADWIFKGSRPCRNRFQASTLAMASVWVMLMLIQRIAGMAKVGMLYFLTWFVYAYLLTYVLSLAVDPINYWSRSPVAFVPRSRELLIFVVQITLSVFLPCLLLHDSATNVMVSMCQSLITGTPPIIVYALASIFAIVATLPIIPFLSLVGDYHKSFLSFATPLWAILLTTLLLVTPLSSDDPASLFWSQSYDLNTRESPVSVFGIVGLDQVAPALLKASARTPDKFNITLGTPFSTLKYEGLEPTFEMPPSHLINLTTHFATKGFKSFSLEAHDTRKCRLQIQTKLTQLNITQSNLTKSIPNPSQTIYLMRRKFNHHPWKLSLTCTPHQIQLQVRCYYDDYTHHIPALVTKSIPPHLTLTTINHVLEVNQQFDI